MRIVCPHCAAAYDVPDGLLTGHKAVRCARCTKEWRPLGLQAAPATIATIEERPVAVPPAPAIVQAPRPPRRSVDLGPMAIDRLMATPQRKSRAGLALGLAWLTSIVLVAALLAASYAERATVMAVWPPSVRLYAALGLASPAP
jgi:predicted Zn finger-like uncharacterized protein